MSNITQPVHTFGAPDVPEVRVFELMSAWDHALEAAFSLSADPEKTYGFDVQNGDEINTLTYTDKDVCLWLYGIDKVLALNTTKGAACAMRFLAIMAFLARHEWAGHLLQSDNVGTLSAHPGLIRSAARLPLLAGETFAESALRDSMTQDANSSLSAAADIQSYME